MDGPPSDNTSTYTSPPKGAQVIAGSCHVSGTKMETQRRSMSQEDHIPSANDFQESTHTQDFGNSPHHTITGEIAVGSGHSAADLREQPVVPGQGQNQTDRTAYDMTIMPVGGVLADSDVTGASVFPIDPMVYGNMMFNFGCAGAFASGIGQQVFRGLVDNGSSDVTFGQGWLGTEPQPQQQSANPPASHDDGWSGITPNPNGPTVWTNASHGFE